MTDRADWHDPFAQDEAARERERRRAEREARRRGVQASVGEKVASDPVPAEVPPPDPAPSAIAAAASAPTSPRQDAQPRPEPVSPPQPKAAGTPPPRDHLLLRRAIGGLIIGAVAALVIFAISKVIDRIDGGSDAKPALVVQKPTSQITIPEGLDRHQIADLVKKDGIKGDYLKATQKPPKHSGFDLADYGASDAPNLEGFLFPDTWDDLPKQATVHDLVDRQLADYQERIKGVDMSYAKSKNLTVYDVVKIASMIEREVQVPEERKLVSSVIYNRLAAGNPLGIDATIRYYLQNYDQPLTESELAQDEPYNTRLYAGLPPTPISNPGLDSLDAAANPAKTDYFYYVIKPGTCGEHTFVKTEAEFEQAQAKYQQALEAQGGSPTNC
ncbi:MAG: endolytic transglycosylase MltG [Solirubrobacterales bacterium]